MINLVFSAGIWDSMPGWLATALLSLCQLIDQVIYVLINWMYRVFNLVAEVDIFKDGTQLQAIMNRIYIIFGIAMLFIFAYNLVLLIINPEGKQLGNMAKVVQNAIISIILIIFLPTIFSYLKTIQNHIVSQNVIGNIVLGTSVTYDEAEETNKQAGVKVALDIYSAFYHPVNETYNSCKNKCIDNGCEGTICSDYVLAYNDAYKNSSITTFIWNKELRDGVKDGDMDYLPIISAVAGGFALWMFVSFALDIGVRVGKLAFYEVISPIPVMMRILPNDKMFDKWFKGYTQTYLAIFVRLLIIYFCMYVITLVPDIFAGLWADSSGDAGIIVALANVVIILGILQFAKDAPKLISDLFGNGGEGVKFGIKDKYKSAAAPLGRVADMARSGVYSKMYGGEDGGHGSFFKGAWRGRHGYDKGVQATDAYSQAISDGSTLSGRTLDRLRTGIGMKTRYDSIGSDVEKQMKKNKIEKRREHNKMVADSISTLKEKAGNIVTDKDSNYKSSTGQYATFIDGKYGTNSSPIEDIVDNGVTYSLVGKGYSEMKAELSKAMANGASAKTINSIQRAISMSNITDNGQTYSMVGKTYSQMKAELARAVSNGASSTTIDDLQSAITNFENDAKVSGNTYDLNDKNYYEMQAILAEATRNKASADTITALERSIAQFEKDTKDIVIDDVLKNNTSNIQGRHLTAMQNAVQDLQEQVAEGAAETIDATTGKLVSGIKDSNGNIITSISDISQFKDADKAVKSSNREMDVTERTIKKQDAKFKAKKADRDYIKNTENKSGK